MKKKDGFTLVEVMVTVAVMGVLAGIVGITMGVLLGQRVKSMAADAKSVLQSTQIVAYSRDDAYIEITQNGSTATIIAYSSSGNEINRAEGRNITMKVGFNGGTPVAVSGTITIHFNRQTGGLLPQKAGDGGTEGAYLSAIEFYGSNNRMKRLTISKLTGKATY